MENRWEEIEEQELKDKFESNEELYHKALRRLEKVKSFLIKNFGSIGNYEDGLNYVIKTIYKPRWYQSVDEILVAVELIRNNIKFEQQVQFKNYRVDFLLPDLKVILEIDSIYHNFIKDKERDKEIKKRLNVFYGHGWQIIRFKGEDVKNNLQKLIPSIIRARDRKIEYERIEKMTMRKM